MFINVTVANSGKLSLQEFLVKILVSIYVSSFKIPKFTFWSRIIIASHRSHKKIKQKQTKIINSSIV